MAVKGPWADLVASVEDIDGEEEGVTPLPLEKIDLEEEALRLFQRVRQYTDRVVVGGEPAEVNTALRVNAALLEKLTELQERAQAVKARQEFEEAVLTALECLPDEWQRKVLERLKAA